MVATSSSIFVLNMLSIVHRFDDSDVKYPLTVDYPPRSFLASQDGTIGAGLENGVLALPACEYLAQNLLRDANGLQPTQQDSAEPMLRCFAPAESVACSTWACSWK